MNGMMLKALWGLWLLAALLPAQAQEVSYIHTDALGSPVAETDANRNVVTRFEYEPYGRRLNASNDDKPGYTGHVMDAATGLAYMQQRYYDPMLGVFLSVDPVTAYEKPIDQFHRYRYANNNPYKFVDPDGRAAGLLSKAVKLALKGGDVAATFAGALEDGRVLVSRDASLGQRAKAAGSLASEVLSPVSARDVKAGVNAIQGADKSISMERAIDAGIEHVGSKADVVMTKGGNVQLTSTATDAAGNTVTKNARFDVNPSSGHVQKQGPHLNLETQVNGTKVGTDPHTPIKPDTIRRGDHE